MRAILLCAGYATRLYPLTQETPKSLLPIGGRPMLNYLMDKILKTGAVDEINVVSNDKFFETFRSWKDREYPKVNLHVLNDGTTSNESRLGAIGDIHFALTQRQIEDDVLVLAGDNLFDFALDGFIRAGQKQALHVTVGVFDVQDLTLARQYGLVEFNAQDMQVSSFLEKPAEPKTTMASMGLYLMPHESLRLLKRYVQGGNNTDQPGHYMQWLVKHSKVFAFPFRGTWYDIGDFDSYHRADQVFRR